MRQKQTTQYAPLTALMQRSGLAHPGAVPAAATGLGHQSRPLLTGPSQTRAQSPPPYRLASVAGPVGMDPLGMVAIGFYHPADLHPQQPGSKGVGLGTRWPAKPQRALPVKPAPLIR